MSALLPVKRDCASGYPCGPSRETIASRKNAMGEYKPDSVSRLNGMTTIHLSGRYPEFQRLAAQRRGQRLIPYLALHRKGLALRRAFRRGTVVSCTAFSPLPRGGAVCFLWRFPCARFALAHPAFQLGILPCGVRTFLPLRSGRPSSIAAFNLMPASCISIWKAGNQGDCNAPARQ